ncbi:MAG: hypothetical protein JXM69_19515, partial [Anaerolineae bacterium]|nr:hypothetical protein [Anaerolineae bacterium]
LPPFFAFFRPNPPPVPLNELPTVPDLSTHHYIKGEWQVVPISTDVLYLNAISMLNPDEGWAVGYKVGYGVILHYHQQHWEEVTVTGTRLGGAHLADVEMVSPEEGWIVGHTIMHYQDGAWQEITLPDGFEKLTDMDIVSADEGWAVGVWGTILHYRDGQWQAVDSPTRKDLFSIDMVSPEEGWAVGKDILNSIKK